VGRPRWRVADIRLVLVGVVLIAAWISIGYRLFEVQGVHAAEYAEPGFDQRVRHEETPAKRGTIYDRDGIELAVTVDASTVVANPSVITDPVATAGALAPILGLDEASLATRLSDPESQFTYVARRIDAAVADRVRDVVSEQDLEGLSIVAEPDRVYPAGSLASQVLGFVQQDDQAGLEGIELEYDDLLSGTPGTRILERDPYGVEILSGELLVEPAIPGSDLVLTIDREIQSAVQEAADQALIDTNAAGATIVVLEVGTGDILAMASAPGFDPNQRDTIDSGAVRNRAVTDVYEPGSTLKVVTISAALQEGIVTPDDAWFVPAELEIPPKEEPYTDEGRTEGAVMSVADIVAHSSNVGTIQIEQQLGTEDFHRYLSSFGLGQSTGSGLPGEVSGLLRPAAEWCPNVCGPSTAIGYRVDVTALQMAALFSTIANDGVWVQPHVVQEIVDSDGIAESTEPQQRPVLSQATAATMRTLLGGVVEVGTGHRAAIDGYTVGGKTGTTQKYLSEEGIYSEDDRIASFIGMAPLSDPRIVVAVVLDSPHGEITEGDRSVDLRFGGVAAAPVFARVAEASLNRLGVAPDAP
jgi:cell division protein FtsI/penicillin-binding protein 2